MENIFEYRNLLNSAITDYNDKSQTALNEYSSKLLENEGVKRAIEQITEPIGDLFLVNPVEKGVKFLGKKAGEYIKSKIDPKPQTSENLNPESQGRTVEFENPVYDPENVVEPVEQSIAPETTSDVRLVSLGDALQDRNLFNRYTRENYPEVAGTDENIENARNELRENMNDLDLEQTSFVSTGPAGEPEPAPGSSSNRIGQLLRENVEGNPPAPQTENAASDAVSNNSSAVADASSSAESSGLSSAGDVLKPLAEVAPEVAPEVGLDLSLLADPLTAIFGLIAGIGTIVGGIEGAESHKNPSVPKPPPMANVSTQFGIGS